MNTLGAVNHEILPLLQALAKSLTVAQLAYLREQFTLLGPNKSGFISMQNFKLVSSFSGVVFSSFNTTGAKINIDGLSRV